MVSASAESAGASAAGVINTQLENGNWRINIKDKSGIIQENITIPKNKTNGNYITVSNLVEILNNSDAIFRFIYFVHCRSTEQSSTLLTGTFPEKPKENSIAIKNSERAFLVVQAHGVIKEDEPLEDFIQKRLLDKIVFRSDIGQRCRQHSHRGRLHVYEGAMAFHAVDNLARPPMTNDRLGLKNMEIILTHYSTVLIPGMKRAGTLTGREPDEVTKRLASNPLETLQEKESKIGGSIRKTVKKRKRKRKSKTRKR